MKIKDQQQVASTVVLSCWHLWHIICVSLQSSQQKGTKASRPPDTKSRKKHQANVTVLTFPRFMLSVSVWHTSQCFISPITAKFVIVALFFSWMTIPPAGLFGGGGGG